MRSNLSYPALLFGGLAIVGLAIWFSLTPKPADNEGKMTVAATFLPVADITQNIGGPDVKVVTLLPPGASPHTFEPTPAQIRELAGVKTVFAIGYGIDDWAKTLVANAPGAALITVEKGIDLRRTDDGQTDPHYWLDVKNGKIMAKNIAQELIRLDPAKSAAYNQRLQDYLISLDKLDERIKDLFKEKTDLNIVTHHAAWNYFAAAYGLKVAGVLEPTPGRELTPNELASLENTIRQNRITTIFSEPELSDQLLKPLAKDTGVKIKNIDPEGGSDGISSYEDILLKNAQIIAQSLK